jgi:hypothetical protein
LLLVVLLLLLFCVCFVLQAVQVARQHLLDIQGGAEAMGKVTLGDAGFRTLCPAGSARGQQARKHIEFLYMREKG